MPVPGAGAGCCELVCRCRALVLAVRVVATRHAVLWCVFHFKQGSCVYFGAAANVERSPVHAGVIFFPGEYKEPLFLFSDEYEKCGTRTFPPQLPPKTVTFVSYVGFLSSASTRSAKLEARRRGLGNG